MARPSVAGAGLLSETPTMRCAHRTYAEYSLDD
jgi:hypothetical protein